MIRQARHLYPAIEPFDHGRVEVPGGHRIYYEQAGNPDGRPVLFVHGGPGGGCEPDDRRYFDSDAYRIVLFDQRGAGRSSPRASTVGNTTRDLIADIERLRSRLGIERWMLFGGSWGSTVSLAYAERHPARVIAMILRGIFLMRREEFDWYYRDGTPAVFPEAAERFHALVADAAEADIVAAYHRMVTGEDQALRRRAVTAWARWEAETSSLRPDPARVARFSDPDFAEAFAGIELHYFAHGGFFERDGQVLAEAGRIRDIPGVIVHGRYDMVCPLRNAVLLARAWTAAELHIVPDAGHDSSEPGTVDALVRATDRFASDAAAGGED